MKLEKLIQDKGLTGTEAAVLEYIVANLDHVLRDGVRGVARANFTSTSTIMRLAKKMGYGGFVDMCYKLRSLVEMPQKTEQEEVDFLSSFGTVSLLNYNTYTQVKSCASRSSGRPNGPSSSMAPAFRARRANTSIISC